MKAVFQCHKLSQQWKAILHTGVSQVGGAVQMQACGQPPPEIVDELAPGLSLGEDGPFGPGPGADNNGSTPPGCPVQ